MTRILLLASLFVLSACHKPTFDERYAQAQHKLEVKAKGIDKDLAASASDAAAAGILPSEEATDAAEVTSERR